MSDLIERQAAIDAVLDMNAEHRVSWMDAVIDIINELPSAQPERPRGRWIEHRRTGIGLWNNYVECSNCGIWFFSENLVRRSFCPNCGADMRTEQMLKLVRAWEKAHRKSAEGEE